MEKESRVDDLQYGPQGPPSVAILQVFMEESDLLRAGWLIVGVYATKEAAEIAASLAGYTRWSVSEFGVIGWGE